MLKRLPRTRPIFAFGLRIFILALLHPLGVSAQTEPPPVKLEKAEMPAAVHQKVAPATVRIICDNGAEFGSGTIIGITNQNRALILTCCHVVAKNFAETDPNIPLEFVMNINVKTAFEDKPLAASVLVDFVDRANDIVLLGTTEGVPVERLISYTLSNKIKPGQAVAALGYPNTDDINETVGHFIRVQGNYLVIDAALGPGNSGGPVVDKSGRMIGMATYVEGKEGYAISMTLVSSVVNAWLQNSNLKKVWRLEKDKAFWQDWRFLAGGAVAVGATTALVLSSSPKGRDDIELPPALP
jgi:S1-C subfamily serine protease